MSALVSKTLETSPDYPAYDEATHLFREAGITTDAAEAHGIITGVLCAPDSARVSWHSLIVGREAGGNRETPAELTELLAAMYRSALAHLNGLECAFTPLLPGDEHSLAEQIDGLTDWCRGYLLGLNAGGLRDTQLLSGDAKEILNDITRISEAEMDTALASEEEEQALVEIVEYLRIGVQLVFEELHSPAMHH